MTSSCKMHFIWVLVLLSAVAASATRPISSSRLVRDKTRLSLCAVASNCETYETEHGMMIRFASGMGPGSAHHERMLASSDAEKDLTMVTIGTNSINYGTTGASGTYGAIHHLYDVCHEGACDSSPFEVDTILAGDVGEQEAKLVLSAEGHYNGYGERDAFVEAVLVAAKQGEICESQTWTQYGPNGQTLETGTTQQCTQTNFISVDKWSNDHNLFKGSIQVQVAFDQSNTLASCNGVSGVLAAIMGLVSAIPSPYTAVAGAVGSGFFGTVSATCG